MGSQHVFQRLPGPCPDRGRAWGAGAEVTKTAFQDKASVKKPIRWTFALRDLGGLLCSVATAAPNIAWAPPPPPSHETWLWCKDKIQMRQSHWPCEYWEVQIQSRVPNLIRRPSWCHCRLSYDTVSPTLYIILIGCWDFKLHDLKMGYTGGHPNQFRELNQSESAFVVLAICS